MTLMLWNLQWMSAVDISQSHESLFYMDGNCWRAKYVGSSVTFYRQDSLEKAERVYFMPS